MELADKIWWTRKARIQAEKRLLSNTFQAQLVLLWYSFFGVFTSIYYLKFNSSNEYAGISWVVYSVLVLVVSVAANGLNFKERAGLIKECYETLDLLYQRAKVNLDAESLAIEYRQILSICENHKDCDNHAALCLEYLSHPDPNHPQNGLNKLPTRYVWLMFISARVIRAALLFASYVFPVIIFIATACF